MDFLDIRKKAKERAQARAAEEAATASRAGAAPRPGEERDEGGAAAPEARAPRGEAGPPPRGEPPAGPAGPVVTEEDVLEGALAARLQGLPAAAEGPDPEPDARFTTWRPGAGAPPALPSEPAFGPPPEASEEEFTIVAPAHRVATIVRDAAVQVPGGEPPPPADPLDEFFYHPAETAPSLPQIAPAADPEERPAPVVREEYLTFLLGAEEYAVAIERVREVIKAPPITEVPRAPAHVVGVVTVRGEVVAVLDPRRRLGLPSAATGEGQGKVVIVDAGDGPCGLLVDHVASVVRLLPGSIEPCPQGIAGQRSELLAGIGRVGDRLFTVLELGAVLRRVPARADGAAPAWRTDARR